MDAGHVIQVILLVLCVLSIQRLNQPNLELKVPENIDDHALNQSYFFRLLKLLMNI